MTDLNEFRKWAKTKQWRIVEIKLNNALNSGFDENIWVYDIELCTGQFANDVSEINLEAEIEKKERRELERLQAKYGAKI